MKANWKLIVQRRRVMKILMNTEAVLSLGNLTNLKALRKRVLKMMTLNTCLGVMKEKPAPTMRTL